MPDEPDNTLSGLPATDLHGRRERTRRSLLRANTAVAFVLTVLMGLALAAIGFGLRAVRLRGEAERNQARAERAEATARFELARAYLAEARATRSGYAMDRRAAALDAVRRAASILPSTDLRNEAIAALALPDFHLDAMVPLSPATVAYAVSADLRWCALGFTNGDIVVRAFAGEKVVSRLSREMGGIPTDHGMPGAMEFSPDGSQLAVRYGGGGFAVWDWESKRTLFRHNMDKFRRLASAPRFSSDGLHIVAPVFSPKDGTAVFEIATGRQVAFFDEFSSFRHVSVRPGAPVFAANNGTNVVVVNWETGERIADFPAAGGVRRTAWSSDGRLLAVAGHFLGIDIWDVAKRQRRVLEGHKGDVWHVVFDPSNERMASASEDGTSRIWDLRQGRVVGLASEGYLVQWSTSNKVAWVRPRISMDLREFAASPVYQRLLAPGAIADGATFDVSADGEWAALGAKEHGLLVWNLLKGGSPGWIEIPGFRSFCFDAVDRKILLTRAGRPELRDYVADFSVVGRPGARQAVSNEIWTTAAPESEQPPQFGFRLGPPTAVPAIPDKRIDLLTMSADAKSGGYVELAAGKVWVRRLDAAAPPVQLQQVAHSSVAGQSSSVRGGGTISLSPDGKYIACGYAARGAVVFDARSGTNLARLAAQHGTIQFSPEGGWIVFANSEGCRVFRTGSWEMVWEHSHAKSGPTTPSAYGVAFSPDARVVAIPTAPAIATVFETSSGRELAALEAPDASPITSVRWTRDGEQVVLATRENHLEAWRLPVLRKELARIGLDWNLEHPHGGPLALKPVAKNLPVAWITSIVFVLVGFVALVALLALRHHRMLIEEFGRTEELAIQRARELAIEREVGHLKSSFVSMVSHEFRTPLGIIQSSAQILDRYLEKLSSAQRRDQLDSITGNVRRMGRLIDEVLLLGKAESGQMRFAPALIDLPSFCRRLTDEMLSATHRRCPIELKVQAGVGAGDADENLLRHILGNLLANAAKYSPAGSAIAFEVARSNGSVVFTIADRGIGIPIADQQKLFTAFYRGSNASAQSGTGLGLTIVKRCVELHGGDISFSSEEAQGTTFTVRLPVFTQSPAHRVAPHDTSSALP